MQPKNDFALKQPLYLKDFSWSWVFNPKQNSADTRAEIRVQVWRREPKKVDLIFIVAVRFKLNRNSEYEKYSV